jgi:hypothetical protein
VHTRETTDNFAGGILDLAAGFHYAVISTSNTGHNMNPSKVSATINDICHDGCDAVNAIIEALEQGNTPPAMDDLSRDEQHEVLKELKQIMAVYKR